MGVVEAHLHQAYELYYMSLELSHHECMGMHGGDGIALMKHGS